jgi:ribosome-binding protein aMBF1 (putative translation factor)
MEVQFIHTESGEELVVLSRRAYDALLASAGDAAAENRAGARILAETQGQTALPDAVWERIDAGEHPIRAVREWRGLTQAALAAEVGLAQGYISGLESRRREGSASTLRQIAKVLGVSLDDLMSEEQRVQRRASTAALKEAIDECLGAKAPLKD